MSTRKQRGLKERIYLLKAFCNNDNEWTLSVKGSSNKIYEIKLSNKDVKCKCMDFSIRGRICKHLYFVLGRVIRESNLLSMINEVDDIKINYELISTLLSQILKNHLQNNVIKKNDISYDKNECCSICFEEFGNESVEQCQIQCKNTFHSECIKIWISKNSTCPLCRCEWITNSNNCLEHFSVTNI